MTEVKGMLQALLSAVDELRQEVEAVRAEVAAVRTEVERIEMIVQSGRADAADEDR